MEIKITKFFNEAPVSDFSGSAVERGANAGAETWSNAKEEAEEESLLTTPEHLQAMRNHVKGFGAWTKEEIESWPDVEINALFIQLVSGDIRETPDMSQETWDWELYEKMAEEGVVGGRMYKGDDGEIYYYLGD